MPAGRLISLKDQMRQHSLPTPVGGQITALSLLLAVLLLALSACTTTPISDSGANAANRGGATPITDPAARAKALLERAEEFTGNDKARLQLEAAEQWLLAEQAKTALSIAVQLDFSTDTDSWLFRRQLLLANASLALKDAQSALDALAFVKNLHLSSAQQITANQVIQQASALIGTQTDWLAALTYNLAVATTEEQLRLAQSRLLRALASYPESAGFRDTPLSARIKPWRRLSQIQKQKLPPLLVQQELQRWQAEYPHLQLAPQLRAEIVNPALQRQAVANHVALLLPYSGPLKSVGMTLHEGILASYYNDMLMRSGTTLTLYDTEGGDDPVALYRQAVLQGANQVIGPLRKEQIQQLLVNNSVTVPTLALNHLQRSAGRSPLLTQIGLNPEDELRQLARLVHSQGLRRAAIIYPNNEWGQRQMRSFSHHWLALGGDVLARRSYTIGDSDFSTPVAQLLGIDHSEARATRLNRLVDGQLQHRPRRRQDIDFVFVAAFAAEARAIKPQLRYHHAAELPVFASSHVFSGLPNQELDRDLDGVVFCDNPISFNAASVSSEEPMPRQSPRLFALGADALGLLPYLQALTASELRSYSGRTGELFNAPGNQIISHLQCGRFRNGIPIPDSRWF